MGVVFQTGSMALMAWFMALVILIEWVEFVDLLI
jgi:hypothetical protein